MELNYRLDTIGYDLKKYDFSKKRDKMTTDAQKLQLLNFWLTDIPTNYLRLPSNGQFTESDKRNILLELRPGTRTTADFFELRDRISDRIRRTIPQISEQNPRLVFVSYSYLDRHIAATIKQALTPAYTVFVAHDDNQISQDFEENIKTNIQSMKYFIPILTTNFNGSTWANQEAGIAYLRNLREEIYIIPVRINDNPMQEPAFLRRIQGINCATFDPQYLSEKILQKINELAT